jgi:thioredoxin-dependent peroxiredoxin
MNLLVLIAIIGLIALIIFLVTPKDSSHLQVGSKAPDFKLPDENGNRRSLSEFRGHKVVLYFYPKDNTPGCTKQACGLRDNYAAFQKNNIVILGVSYDSPSSHRLFKEKYALPFILLSDENKVLAKKYGAYASILNALYPERKTFLIDEQGRIVHIFDTVDLASHSSDVLKAFGITEPQETPPTGTSP